MLARKNKTLARHNKRTSELSCYSIGASSPAQVYRTTRGNLQQIGCALWGLAIHFAFSRSVMNDTDDGMATQLRIAIAYVKLCCIPEHSSEASVLLFSSGNYEIRMFRRPDDFEGAPLFWLELFDHNTKTSVDSFGCLRIKDAVPILIDFISQSDGDDSGAH
jgi:hypothetical protein